MFGDLESVDWASKITLNKMRKNNVRSFFNYNKVNFYYLDSILGFNLIIESFQFENTNIVDYNSCNIFG